MLEKLKALASAHIRSVHAVGAAFVAPRQPLLHIVLHPFVPYAKYALPIAGIVAIGHIFSLDAMMMRILSDDEAKRRHIQEGRHGRDAVQHYNRDCSSTSEEASRK